MSHATLAAREVLIIPSLPVVIANRLDTRETTVSSASGLLAEISSDRERRRLGYRAMAGETNDRPSTLRQKTAGRPPLRQETCRRADSGADRRALAGIPPDGAADGAEGGASGTAPDRSALLRRRGGDLYGLRGIHAGLALCPVVAVELIALELVLALTLLGIHEHFGTGRAGEHQQCQHRADGHQSLHVSPPWKTVTAPAGQAWPARR